MRVTAIIQARMGSTRLPRKVLSDIGGKPMLWHVINRVQQAQMPDLVVVATSDHQADDALAGFCNDVNVLCFRGNLTDVLDRYYQAAKYFEAHHIARLTGDCPLLDPLIIDKVIRTYQDGNYDFVGNGIFKRTYPDGLDVGIFSFWALEYAWRHAKLKSEREHVTPYMQKHPELFRLGDVLHSEDLSALRWTVDEPEDLEFVRHVYSHFGSQPFGMKDLLAYLDERPELTEINSMYKCNEGYQKSLREDGIFEPMEAT